MPDQVPTLAALAPFLSGRTKITDVGHLRIKESDRLAVMSRELTRAGAAVEEFADGLVIDGRWSHEQPPSTPIVVDPEDDHRIAMSLALVGLRRPGVTIADPHVVEKSYPDFWRHLEEILR
jgi:3-phosphoshikimate 1-carboxyvinyltransferase